MESSALTSIFLPLALGIIMLGLGLSLTLDDFKRVVLYPKAILIGLVCQMILLPTICFVHHRTVVGFVHIFLLLQVARS